MRGVNRPAAVLQDNKLLRNSTLYEAADDKANPVKFILSRDH